MRRIYRALGIAITVISIGFFVAYAVRNADEFPTYQWTVGSSASLGAASIIYLGVVAIGGLAWHLLLAGAGGSPGLGPSYTIFSLSQIAKYLPGNIGHHVGRVAMSSARGLPAPRVLLTMALEAGWLILASAIFGLGWLIFAAEREVAASFLAPRRYLVVAFSMAAVVAPIVAGWLLPRLADRYFLGEANIESTHLPGFATLAAVLGLYGVSFLVVGGIISLLLQAFYGLAGTSLLFHTGLFSIAWVAGFLTPGAPAGLGVRDVILVAVLGSTYGATIALGLTILLRMVTLGGDGLAFVVGLIAKRMSW